MEGGYSNISAKNLSFNRKLETQNFKLWQKNIISENKMSEYPFFKKKIIMKHQVTSRIFDSLPITNIDFLKDVYSLLKASIS